MRWVEAHSTNKGTEIQSSYVTARGDRAMNLASGLFIKGGNALLSDYGFKVWILLLITLALSNKFNSQEWMV